MDRSSNGLQGKFNEGLDLTSEGLNGDDKNGYCLKCNNKDNTVLNLNQDDYIPKVDNSKVTFKQWLKQKANRKHTTKLLHRRIPIISWLPNYTREEAVSDLIAGLTVGLTLIPQAIAISNVAAQPPQVGLYSSFMSCFVYTIFGTVKDAPVGPTAIAGLLTRENNFGFGIDGAIILCFLSGCVLLIMGLLQLGFLIDFISGPVSVGFTSAAAIIIGTTQVEHIFGIKVPGDKFVEVWGYIFNHISETRLYDALLGIICIVVILLLRKVKDIKIGPDDPKQRKPIHNILAKSIWLISTARNITVVIISGALAYGFSTETTQPFILTGTVKQGLPSIQPPPFEIEANNRTYNFIEITSTIGSGLIIVPLILILESIALAKAFADGKAVDANQEMMALGLCNIVSSFFGSMPITGALARGAVNNASGVRTTFGGVYSGLLVIFSLQFFTPYFFYIPKASLAAVIISAVIFMIELHVFKPIWKTKKIDLIPAVVTFIACLFLRLEIGIAIGIGINVLYLLYASARPSVHVEKAVTSSSACEYLLITPDRSLTFPSVDYVRATVTKACAKQVSKSIPVVIDARHIQGADFTAAKGIKLLIEDFIKRGQPLLFHNLKPSIVAIFQGVQPKGFVYCNSYAELDMSLKQYYQSDPSETNGHAVTHDL